MDGDLSGIEIYLAPDALRLKIGMLLWSRRFIAES